MECSSSALWPRIIIRITSAARCSGSKWRGVPTLLTKRPVPVHVHDAEAAGVRAVTGASESDLVRHRGGDVLQVGRVGIELLHTPGHTPGSQCFLVDGRLVAGDTLFVQGCGRVDLPGGDAEEMYRTLTQRLANLPDTVVLYPGHDYGDVPSSSFAEQRRTNGALRPRRSISGCARWGCEPGNSSCTSTTP
jgi:glyoxylase-like metal-dependent hydrolase (beta-lactamase superfamily II)